MPYYMLVRYYIYIIPWMNRNRRRRAYCFENELHYKQLR